MKHFTFRKTPSDQLARRETGLTAIAVVSEPRPSQPTVPSVPRPRQRHYMVPFGIGIPVMAVTCAAFAAAALYAHHVVMNETLFYVLLTGVIWGPFTVVALLVAAYVVADISAERAHVKAMRVSGWAAYDARHAEYRSAQRHGRTY